MEKLAGVLKNIPVVNTKLTSGGNVVMSLRGKWQLLGIKKIRPKIMKCNILKEENETDVIDYLIAKNSYLQCYGGTRKGQTGIS